MAKFKVNDNYIKDDIAKWDVDPTGIKQKRFENGGEMAEIPTVQTGNDMVDTASQGASLGASLGKLGTVGGPWGAAIGAVAGGVLGGLKARAKRKEANRQATADMYLQKANIEANTQVGRQAALSGLANRLAVSLR